MRSLGRMLRGLRKRALGRTGIPSQTGIGHANGTPVHPSVDKNLDAIRAMTGSSSDLAVRRIELGGFTLGLAMIEGLVNRDAVDRDIVGPLLARHAVAGRTPARSARAVARHLAEATIATMTVWQVESIEEATYCLLDGHTIVFGGGWREALVASTQHREARPVSEPAVESVIRGPREGFTEDIRVNTSLIRMRLRTPRLRIEELRLGTLTNTRIAIAYVDGLTPEYVLEEIRRRLAGIRIDGILESGYIEEMIEDAPLSPFPTIRHTERPDLAVHALLQGSAVLLTEGTPFALIMPMTFMQLMNASEDYYNRWPATVGIRLFRWMSMFIALSAPAFYVALTTFHQELIPTHLAVAIAQQRERVPYPAIVEALLMVVAFEVMIEAGIRLPRPIGQAVTIVGALVIGEAGVRAGLVSEAMVIDIALTALASFALPSYDVTFVVRIVRLPLTIVAGTLGIFGMLASFLAILIHMATLKSFGVPYLAGIAPALTSEQKDMILRAPRWTLATRPRLTGFRDLRRMEPRPDMPALAARRRASAAAERILTEAEGERGTGNASDARNDIGDVAAPVEPGVRNQLW